MFKKILFAASLALAATSALAQDERPLADILTDLGAAPCDTGELTCVTLSVPKDPQANDPEATLDITFAVSLATGDSKSVLFYVVGGPGISGLAVADGYLTAFDSSLTENMDIVFFDQRGIGPVHGIGCPVAQQVFDSADMGLADPAAAKAVAQGYVADCLAELGPTDLLGLVGTEVAIADLEAFRQAIGAPQVAIYGESYGTQFAQSYATAYPDAVSAVILDGTVDLALSFAGYYDSYVAASERILARMLAECDALPACRTDMQGSAAEAYDRLAARLAEGPAEVMFPTDDGGPMARQFTGAMLETNAFYSLYGPEDRAGFLRSLAATARGDLLPMLRLSDYNLLLDPATGAAVPDPSWFGAAYYAVTCADYGIAGDTPAARADLVMAEAAAFAPQAPRLLRAHFAERLACAYWPETGPVERPAPFAGGDYPTLILNADTDPITPVTMAYSVFDHVQNGYLVVMEGGPHVIWGRGLACPDQIVGNLLFDGTLPDAQVQICRQEFVEGYEPLTLTDPAQAADPLRLARSLQTELYQSYPFYSWGGEEPMTIGCDHGGTVTISAGEGGTDYAFANCSWWPEVMLNGNGLLVEDGEPYDALTLTLSVSGAHAGEISYTNWTMTEAAALSGTWDGAEIASPRPLP
jgi:pimeloyl-ACP methyl ester carboxylesterase